MSTLLSACNGGKQSSCSITGDTLRLKHAKNLLIVSHDGYSVVSMIDPWEKSRTLHQYILLPQKMSGREREIRSLFPDADILQVPLKRMLVGTTVHSSLLNELNAKETIVGTCDVQYIRLNFILEGVKSGKIKDCGSGMQPNFETIVELSPEAMLFSPYQGVGSYGKLSQLGIPIIELADYMESTALGRAEWMIFYGMLVGKQQEAEKIFAGIEQEYQRIKSLAAQQPKSAKIMMDKMMQGVWFVPGGASTIGQLLKDANADYIFAADTTSGSLEKSFEQIISVAEDAEIWLLRYGEEMPGSLSGLLAENAKYKLFRPAQTGNVYGCDTRNSGFFDETPFHPEYLLSDFAAIAHPPLHLKPNRYFHKLSDSQ